MLLALNESITGILLYVKSNSVSLVNCSIPFGIVCRLLLERLSSSRLGKISDKSNSSILLCDKSSSVSLVNCPIPFVILPILLPALDAPKVPILLFLRRSLLRLNKQ